MLKAIFFDYHGVLDKRTLKFAMHNLIVKKTYDPASGLSLAEYEHNFSERYLLLNEENCTGIAPPEKFWQELERTGIPHALVERAWKYILTIEPNQALWKLLPILRKKYHLGILSDCSTDKLALILQHYDLSKYFDAWYFSCDHQLTKRDPEFFGLMRADNRFARKECVFVDDQENKVAFAKSLGFQAITFKNASALLAALNNLE